MFDAPHDIRFRLLDEFQRRFPLVPRPFAAMATALGTTEDDVLEQLRALKAEGAIARLGATVRPNTVAASTLAAMAVPPGRIAEVSVLLSSETGVNHSYLREDEWNLWFVVTAPDEAMLLGTLHRITAATGLQVLDLRLVRPFHIDLGFRLAGRTEKHCRTVTADMSIMEDRDRALLQALCQGLALVPEPYRNLGETLGLAEDVVRVRIGALEEAGIISRFGIIVRHRPLGFTANAMVVWQLPDAAIAAAGEVLARLPGVTLCYQRRTVPDLWPYPLYIMVHGRSRAETSAAVARAAALPELAGARSRVLFSSHCFKQTGAWIHGREAAA